MHVLTLPALARHWQVSGGSPPRIGPRLPTVLVPVRIPACEAHGRVRFGIALSAISSLLFFHVHVVICLWCSSFSASSVGMAAAKGA